MFRRTVFGPAAALAVLGVIAWGSASARADASGYQVTTYSPTISIEGGFNVSGGLAHYWNANSGYHVLDTHTGVVTDIGYPSSYSTNYGGDPFGVYDAASQKFYAATYASGFETFLYVYDHPSNTWSDAGQAVNMYGGTVSNGELYISGLREPWSGGFDTNYISLYDFSGNNLHDALIETGGASAHVAVDNVGNVYYAAYGGYGVSGELYRWDASAVQSAINSNLVDGEEDTYLTLTDGTLLSTLPAGGNGIAVDDDGVVFFTVNQWGNPDASGIMRWDPTMNIGDSANYEVILSAADVSAGWFGPLAIEGSFDSGATLFTSLNFNAPISGITAIPEPTTLGLLAAGGLVMLGRRRRSRCVRASHTARSATRSAVPLAAIALLLAVGSTAMAGVFSPGKGGTDEAAFIDAGIAGFVGPAGEGVTATATNGNYVNPIFKGWATGVVLYDPSDNVGTYGQNGIGSQFADPSLTLGQVTGSNMDIVSLGDMDATEIAAHQSDPAANPLGTLILSFDKAITNGTGADFAAFENGFVSNYNTGAGSVAGQMFAELGYVEVSTDGTDFARFPSQYLNSAPTGSQAYLTQDVSNIYNLVGKHANAYGESWGTPFDLDDLLDDQLVIDGLVDLNEINFVRIIDIPGDGTFTDSLGNPIYDSWVTWGSGGMDFEALGVINQVPEPASLALLGAGLVMVASRRRLK